MIAVDQFVEHKVPLGVATQVGGSDKLIEVSSVVVEVAGHPKLALGGEVDDLLYAERFHAVFVRRRTERFDHVIGTDLHWRSGIPVGGVRQRRGLSDKKRSIA